MQNKVQELCKKIGSRKCTGNMSEEELKINLKKNQECAAAREKMNKICFRGGNLGHKQRLDDELGAIKRCREFLKKCK